MAAAAGQGPAPAERGRHPAWRAPGVRPGRALPRPERAAGGAAGRRGNRAGGQPLRPAPHRPGSDPALPGRTPARHPVRPGTAAADAGGAGLCARHRPRHGRAGRPGAGAGQPSAAAPAAAGSDAGADRCRHRPVAAVRLRPAPAAAPARGAADARAQPLLRRAATGIAAGLCRGAGGQPAAGGAGHRRPEAGPVGVGCCAACGTACMATGDWAWPR
ncbi:hypothetical protein G6F23_012888 [Rhizopus arrhizus]|nr:hypothetical protein G6F23_012888 [Rhizopus arrhizus]